MDQSSHFEDSDFLHFATNIYKQAHREQACLWLQDHEGVNVVLLLFCGWLDHQHYTVNKPWLNTLLNEATQWSSHCITPLRNSRRWLKQHASFSANKALYQQIKSAELKAEFQQMHWLEKHVIKAKATNDIIQQASGQGLELANSHHYLTWAGVCFNTASSQNGPQFAMLFECFKP